MSPIFMAKAGVFTACQFRLSVATPQNPAQQYGAKDTVNVKAVTDMVTDKSKALGGTSTLDLKSNTSGFWIIPLFVVFYRSVEVSGNAVK